MTLKRAIVPLLTAVLAAASGCYEMTWFYPGPGQGELVTNGERLGVAKKLSSEDAEEQSFAVLSVRQAYTAAADGNLRRTIVQVTANIVNRAPAPARFETGNARLEVAGRTFAPKWVTRSPPRGGSPGAGSGDRDEIAPGAHVRFDLHFDLGPHTLGRYAGPMPIDGGIPLWSLKEFFVSWEAEWAGEKTSGRFRFIRDYSRSVGSGWRHAPGVHWGYGWWFWPYSWPTGMVVMRPFYPWRSSLFHALVGGVLRGTVRGTTRGVVKGTARGAVKGVTTGAVKGKGRAAKSFLRGFSGK